MTTVSELMTLLKGDFSSLIIGFNDHHAANYTTASGWAEEYREYQGDDEDIISWVSEEERLKAIKENSVWTIQWYPNSPVGFYCVGASTFEKAAEYAISVNS